MKKIFFLFLLSSLFGFAQTGIGTTTPVNKFQVETILAEPATTGVSANGNFRLSGTTGSHVLDFGLSSAATYSWLQSRSRSNYGTNFNLVLNPNGGNVGIGTTSPGDQLVVGTFAIHEGGNKVIGFGYSPGASRNLLTGFPAEIRLDPNSGRLSFGTSAASFALGATPVLMPRMSITSQGNVGIGNISPGATLEIGSSNGSVPGNLILNPTTTGTGVEGAEINFRPAPLALEPAAQTWAIDQVSDANNPRLRFFPGSSGETKGFTIKDNGYFGIGTATPRAKLHVQSADNTSIYIESTTTDNNGMVLLNANTNQNWSSNWHEFMYFQNQGANIGGILGTSNGTQVIFSTTSDYRLKTDFKSFNGLDIVNKIKTYDYAWKLDQSRMYGVKAHELYEVLPYAVTGNKDAFDIQGKIIPQMVDYSKLTPILVKAIQEQDLKLKEQQNQIDAMMKRIEQLETKK